MRAEYPTPQQTDALRQLWQEAFGDDDAFLDLFWDTAFAPDRCRCIGSGRQAAAALYWFDCRCQGLPYAYIYAVATEKSHRGQGLCRELMEDTHRTLRSLGYAGCILVPGSDDLRQMYSKMGYCNFSGMDTLQVTAHGCAQLEAVDAQQYATLRKQYLPQGAVEQEGISFLAGYAQLYAGSDFLVAVSCQGEVLTGLELLGNTQMAAAITGALGKGKGIFRIPGSNPFAMYHPLSDHPQPGWFGLAFD